MDRSPRDAHSWSQSVQGAKILSKSCSVFEVAEAVRASGPGESPQQGGLGASCCLAHALWGPQTRRSDLYFPIGKASSVDSDQSHSNFHLYAFSLTCLKKRHSRIIVLFYEALGSTLSRSHVKTGHLCWSTIISNKYL